MAFLIQGLVFQIIFPKCEQYETAGKGQNDEIGGVIRTCPYQPPQDPENQNDSAKYR